MTALLVEGEDFRGAIDRGSLPDEAADEADALAYVAAPPTIAADASVEDALEALHGLESLRLVVLDADDSRLLGLVCLNSSGTSFCLGS
jgi:CBS domain-containing protein